MLRTAVTPREEGVGVGPDGRETLPGYCKKLGSHPLLTKKEEIDLCRRIAKGDPEARDKLILHNMRLIISIARPYASTSSHLKWEDLIQAGTIGAITAVEKFNLSRKCRFTTHAAWWIRQSICRELENCGDTIRIPAYVKDRRNKILNTARRLSRGGTPPAIEGIAKHLRVSARFVYENLETLHLKDPVSLDSPRSLEDPARSKIQDSIPDAGWVSPVRIIEAKQDLEKKYRVLKGILRAVKDSNSRKNLKERDLSIFMEIHGLNDTGESGTLAQVARKFGVTRERVRQIQERIYSRLRRRGVANKKAFERFLLSIEVCEKIVGSSIELNI